ncbi:MAG: pantoate--beta-alanine ligase [Candidatus Aminicenantes bacterium RBG_16_63_16]|nr:MAG: pantoate--beta-alanine ligase [Candidatus Aminicenantes bacterium RBG_16_63_16]
MIRIQTIVGMKAEAWRQSAAGRTIGFVPTMGALHEGHLSLVRESRGTAAVTVVSIFVNPLQFGAGEDLKKYPRNIERDAALLEKEGVDALFLPAASEMYPPGFQTTVEVTRLQENLCGAARPGHFKGVATVVLKLLNIVQPDIAFFGQKDAQQAVILRRMAADLNLDVSIRIMPIVREPDGLALSSRNAYLSAGERQAALVLARSLAEARRAFEGGERRAAAITARVRDIIAGEPLARVDYVETVGWPDLERLEAIDRDVLVAIAVYVGATRLIDNIILTLKE